MSCNLSRLFIFLIWFCAFSVWFRVFPFWLSLRFSLLEYRLLRVETNTNARERQVGGRWTGFAVGLRQPKEQHAALDARCMRNAVRSTFETSMRLLRLDLRSYLVVPSRESVC